MQAQAQPLPPPPPTRGVPRPPSHQPSPPQTRGAALPLLRPTLIFLVVFSSIGFLRIFDQVFNMSSIDPGGPLGSTKPLVLMIYQTAFSSYDMGYASAQTVVLFTILLVISLFQLWLMRERE